MATQTLKDSQELRQNSQFWRFLKRRFPRVKLEEISNAELASFAKSNNMNPEALIKFRSDDQELLALTSDIPQDQSSFEEQMTHAQGGHGPGGFGSAAALGFALLSREKIEQMEDDPEYKKIEEGLIEKWKKDNKKEHLTDSKEGLDYLYGSLDNPDAPNLKKDAEIAFRQAKDKKGNLIYKKQIEKYDKKKQEIHKDPKKDPAVRLIEATIQQEQSDRLAYFKKAGIEVDETEINRKIEGRAWERFTASHQEKAGAYSQNQNFEHSQALKKALERQKAKEALRASLEGRTKEVAGQRVPIDIKYVEKTHRAPQPIDRVTPEQTVEKLSAIKQEPAKITTAQDTVGRLEAIERRAERASGLIAPAPRFIRETQPFPPVSSQPPPQYSNEGQEPSGGGIGDNLFNRGASKILAGFGKKKTEEELAQLAAKQAAKKVLLRLALAYGLGVLLFLSVIFMFVFIFGGIAGPGGSFGGETTFPGTGGGPFAPGTVPPAPKGYAPLQAAISSTFGISMADGFSINYLNWTWQILWETKNTSFLSLLLQGSGGSPVSINVAPSLPGGGQDINRQLNCSTIQIRSVSQSTGGAYPEPLFKIVLIHELSHIIEQCVPDSLSKKSSLAQILNNNREAYLTNYSKNNCAGGTNALNEDYAEMLAYYLNPEIKEQSLGIGAACEPTDPNKNPYDNSAKPLHKNLASEILGVAPSPTQEPTDKEFVASCPIPNGNIICPSYGKLAPGEVIEDPTCVVSPKANADEADIVGHCGPLYREKYPELCTDDTYISGVNLRRTAKSIDIVNESTVPGQEVFLPSIKGQILKWRYKGVVPAGGDYGFIRLFESEPTSDGIWSLHYTHVNSNDPSLSVGAELRSGQVAATLIKQTDIFEGDDATHLHFTIGLNVGDSTSNLKNYSPGWKFPDRELGMCK